MSITTTSSCSLPVHHVLTCLMRWPQIYITCIDQWTLHMSVLVSWYLYWKPPSTFSQSPPATDSDNNVAAEKQIWTLVLNPKHQEVLAAAKLHKTVESSCRMNEWPGHMNENRHVSSHGTRFLQNEQVLNDEDAYLIRLARFSITSRAAKIDRQRWRKVAAVTGTSSITVITSILDCLYPA